MYCMGVIQRSHRGAVFMRPLLGCSVLPVSHMQIKYDVCVCDVGGGYVLLPTANDVIMLKTNVITKRV